MCRGTVGLREANTFVGKPIGIGRQAWVIWGDHVTPFLVSHKNEDIGAVRHALLLVLSGGGFGGILGKYTLVFVQREESKKHSTMTHAGLFLKTCNEFHELPLFFFV